MAGRDDANARRCGFLCAAEYPRFVGALGLYLGDRAVAEEVAQEALLRACQRWERVSKLDSPGGWTWHVARNLATSHLRRRRSERTATARAAANQPGGVVAEDDNGEDVRAAVAALPDRQKTALVLRYYLDLSVDETARRMGVTPDAVRSLTKRAVAELRTTLTTAWPLVAGTEAHDV